MRFFILNFLTNQVEFFLLLIFKIGSCFLYPTELEICRIWFTTSDCGSVKKAPTLSFWTFCLDAPVYFNRGGGGGGTKILLSLLGFSPSYPPWTIFQLNNLIYRNRGRELQKELSKNSNNAVSMMWSRRPPFLRLCRRLRQLRFCAKTSYFITSCPPSERIPTM